MLVFLSVVVTSVRAGRVALHAGTKFTRTERLLTRWQCFVCRLSSSLCPVDPSVNPDLFLTLRKVSCLQIHRRTSFIFLCFFNFRLVSCCAADIVLFTLSCVLCTSEVISVTFRSSTKKKLPRKKMDILKWERTNFFHFQIIMKTNPRPTNSADFHNFSCITGFIHCTRVRQIYIRTAVSVCSERSIWSFNNQ